MEQAAITDRYMSFLENVLTPNRLRHSLGVAQVMAELASIYNLDAEKASTAAMLHDAAKDLPPARRKRLIEEAGLVSELAGSVDEAQDYGLYMHGPVGAYFVQKELGISDPVILDAICMHSFSGRGENFHAPMAWCLRFADVLEPNRQLSDPRWAVEVEWFAHVRANYQQAVYAGRLIEGAQLHTAWIIKMFEEKGFTIHPNIRLVPEELA